MSYMNHYELYVYSPGINTFYTLVDSGMNVNSVKGVYSDIGHLFPEEVFGEISFVISSLLFGHDFNKDLLADKFNFVYDVEVVNSEELEFDYFLINFKTP